MSSASRRKHFFVYKEINSLYILIFPFACFTIRLTIFVRSRSLLAGAIGTFSFPYIHGTLLPSTPCRYLLPSKVNGTHTHSYPDSSYCPETCMAADLDDPAGTFFQCQINSPLLSLNRFADAQLLPLSCKPVHAYCPHASVLPLQGTCQPSLKNNRI